jgi:hypothetical protein
MNNRIGYISKAFLCVTLLLGAAGCSEFLDESDPSNLTPESFYTQPKHADAAIAATYASTRERRRQRPLKILTSTTCTRFPMTLIQVISRIGGEVFT